MNKETLFAKNKITLATVKTFIKAEGLLIETRTRFDGMTDGCERCGDTSIRPVELGAHFAENTLGIHGAWFVLRGGDYLRRLETQTHYGIEVYNCCGTFNLWRAKAA